MRGFLRLAVLLFVAVGILLALDAPRVSVIITAACVGFWAAWLDRRDEKEDH